MKVSVCLTYHNKKQLLINTLESIKKSKLIHDTEVLIVDDASTDEHRIEDIVNRYSNDMYIKFHRFEPSEKTWKLQIPVHNKLIAMATGEVIIQQGAECYHVHDIIYDSYNRIKLNDYLVYGCYALTPNDTNNLTTALNNNVEFTLKTNDECDWNTIFTEGGWYQHTKYRAANLNFCTVISRDDLLDLGGFDERFSNGHGGGDMEFLLRIRRKRMNIIPIDDLYVYHQYHTPTTYPPGDPNHNLYYNTVVFENIIRVKNSYL